MNSFFIVANTYGSINGNGIDDNDNDYFIFNTDQSITLAGFVSNVSIEFCSLPTSASPSLWIYVVEYTGSPNYYISRSMYAVPINQISTSTSTQQYTFPEYQVNVSVGEYIGVGFGSTTGGSPCQVFPGNSSYTNSYGGANQSYLVGIQGSLYFASQMHGVSVSYTVLTLV